MNPGPLAHRGLTQECSGMDLNRDIPPEQSLIEFPCHFPIKVMGANVEGYLDAMLHIARAFDARFDASTVEQRPSKAGNYLGLTLSVYVSSREQLDELYRTLTTHPMVKVVL
jgi:putative lipoic acid-binding regulatory protein